MVQPGVVINGFEYESPEAQTLGPVPSGVKQLTIAAAETMLKDTCPHAPSAFLKVPFQEGRADIEDPQFQEWAQAVAEELPAPPAGADLQQIDLRVIRNSYHMRTGRLLNPDMPFYNVHTDFRTRLFGDGYRYYLSRFSRRAFVLNGLGSQILEGVVAAPEAMQFRSVIMGTDFDPEKAMSFFRMPLVGEDSQLLRGPAVSNPLCLLKGDYEVRNMPQGEWFDIPAATAHRTPPDIDEGRLMATIHYYPKAPARD